MASLLVTVLKECGFLKYCTALAKIGIRSPGDILKYSDCPTLMSEATSIPVLDVSILISSVSTIVAREARNSNDNELNEVTIIEPAPSLAPNVIKPVSTATQIQSTSNQSTYDKAETDTKPVCLNPDELSPSPVCAVRYEDETLSIPSPSYSLSDISLNYNMDCTNESMATIKQDDTTTNVINHTHIALSDDVHNTNINTSDHDDTTQHPCATGNRKRKRFESSESEGNSDSEYEPTSNVKMPAIVTTCVTRGQRRRKLKTRNVSQATLKPKTVVNTQHTVSQNHWSEARKNAWKHRHEMEESFCYQYNLNGEDAKTGKWNESEHRLYIERVKQVGVRKWGSFSKTIPGRVGYACADYWKQLLKRNIVRDNNWYRADDKMRFKWKNARGGSDELETAKRFGFELMDSDQKIVFKPPNSPVDFKAIEAKYAQYLKPKYEEYLKSKRPSKKRKLK